VSCGFATSRARVTKRNTWLVEARPRHAEQPLLAGARSALYNEHMATLLLLFIVVPVVELALLIEIGSRIGTLGTIGLIVLTGLVGAALARWQGFLVLRRMQEQVARGELPASSLIDGVLILIAAAFLVTPGILTDAVGFALLVPAVRLLLRRAVRRRIERNIERGQLRVSVWEQPPSRRDAEGGPAIDIRPEPNDNIQD